MRKISPLVPITLVTLTLPYPLVTFRLKALYFRHLTRDGAPGASIPEVK
jgi:hypothetical protein